MFQRWIVGFVIVFLAVSCVSEQAAWEAAVADGSDAAFDAYRREFPKGEHVDDARSGSDVFLWEQAQQAGTVRGYQSYLYNGYQGFKEEAHQAIDDLLWVAASANAPTSDGIRRFIQDYRKSSHLAEAAALLEQTGWAEVSAEEPQTAEMFSAFIAEFEEGSNLEAAKRRRDELRWRDCQEAHSSAACAKYLSATKESKFVNAEARELEELCTWEEALAKGRAFEIDRYVRDYPEGRFASEAKDKLEDYAWSAFENTPSILGFVEYRAKYAPPDEVEAKQALASGLIWTRIEALLEKGLPEESGEVGTRLNLLDNFLVVFDGSAEAGQAKLALASLMWRKAELSERLVDAVSYTNRFPDGTHAEETRTRLAADAAAWALTVTGTGSDIRATHKFYAFGGRYQSGGVSVGFDEEGRGGVVLGELAPEPGVTWVEPESNNVLCILDVSQVASREDKAELKWTSEECSGLLIRMERTSDTGHLLLEPPAFQLELADGSLVSSCAILVRRVEVGVKGSIQGLLFTGDVEFGTQTFECRPGGPPFGGTYTVGFAGPHHDSVFEVTEGLGIELAVLFLSDLKDAKAILTQGVRTPLR